MSADVVALHEAFPEPGRFPSSESVLADARHGVAGCISATANVTAPLAARVWSGDDTVKPPLAAIREAIASVPLIPRATISSASCTAMPRGDGAASGLLLQRRSRLRDALAQTAYGAATPT